LPETKDKNSFSEDIRKFLIEHELGRRIARMFLQNLKMWKNGGEKGSMEPLARFLKSYSVFITDHTGKEDKFFDIIEEKSSLSVSMILTLSLTWFSLSNGGDAQFSPSFAL
jgi:hemerythrin-like domain-containing protein